MTAKTPGHEFRDLIARELKRQKRSRYWLAQAIADDPCGNATADTVYRYLRGEQDTTGAVVAACLRALEITVDGLRHD